MVARGDIKPGYGVDDHAALHFRGKDLAGVVTSRGSVSAYRVEGGSDGAIETRLEVMSALNLSDKCGPALAKQEIEMELP